MGHAAPAAKQPSLRTRVSLLITGVVAVLALLLGGLWLASTHDSINEEISAATRVCEQWLGVLTGDEDARLLERIKAAGRIRANALAVLDRSGRVVYLSPRPVYKAGRDAPAWFAAIVEPVFVQRRITAGSLTLVLTPDPSRASLDAWDSALAIMAWAGVLLAALFVAIRWALNLTLHPLDQVRSALESTGRGRFDIRLPVYGARELSLLAHAYNGMADRLGEAVNDNVRLNSETELSRLMQERLEGERRSIAQELHDELAQGITAVRALAGAIAQRTTGQAALHGHAQSIVAVTNQIQEGIRHILHQLRPMGSDSSDLNQALQRYLQLWQQHYPQLKLDVDLCSEPLAVSDELALTVLRIVQEGLTNVVRHANAGHVRLALHYIDHAGGKWLELTLTDNGRGLSLQDKPSGFGLTGMRERVAALHGVLSIASKKGSGVRLRARLPAVAAALRQTL